MKTESGTGNPPDSVCGFGQVMALDVSAAPPKLIRDPAAVMRELRWAASFDAVESTWTTDGAEGGPWEAHLSGEGSFLGLYRNARRKRTLLVLCCTAIRNQAALAGARATCPDSAR